METLLNQLYGASFQQVGIGQMPASRIDWAKRRAQNNPTCSRRCESRMLCRVRRMREPLRVLAPASLL